MREEGQHNLTDALVDALSRLDALAAPQRPPCPSQHVAVLRETFLRMYGDLRHAYGILDTLESERR